jgi:hypothetical protein
MLGEPTNHAGSTLRKRCSQSWWWVPGHGWLSAWQLLACQANLTPAFITIHLQALLAQLCLDTRAVPAVDPPTTGAYDVLSNVSAGMLDDSKKAQS